MIVTILLCDVQVTSLENQALERAASYVWTTRHRARALTDLLAPMAVTATRYHYIQISFDAYFVKTTARHNPQFGSSMLLAGERVLFFQALELSYKAAPTLLSSVMIVLT